MKNLTDEQIRHRLDWVESMLWQAHQKDLPYLNITFQKLLDEQVRRDLERQDRCKPTK
jgi:hypothetical protein